MNNTYVEELFNEAMNMGIDLMPLAEWLQASIDEAKVNYELATMPYTTSSEEVVIYGPEDVEILRITASSENTIDDINQAVAQELEINDIDLWGYYKNSKRVNQVGTSSISDLDRKEGNIYLYLPEVAKPKSLPTSLPSRQLTRSRTMMSSPSSRSRLRTSSSSSRYPSPSRRSRAMMSSSEEALEHSRELEDMFRSYGLDPSKKYTVDI